jgi:integrase
VSRAVRLAKGLVEAAEPGLRDRFLWDAEVRGFGLKLTPAGGRSYVLQYRFAGRSRRYTMGPHGRPWTVETARARARMLLRLLAQGRDPQAERLAARADLTVTELCDRYLAEGLLGRSAHALASARRSLDLHVKPRLGAMMVSQVMLADVERLVIAVAEDAGPGRGGRAAAAAALAALRAAYGFGVRRGLCCDNPARGARSFRRRRVTRFLADDDYDRLGRVLAAAEALGAPNPVAVAAIRLILVTGLRPGEVLALTRRDVDYAGGALRVTNGRGARRWAPVGPAALALVAALPRRPGNPHLFPGRGRTGQLSDLQPVWGRLRGAAGLEGVRLLDLRHSFASRAAGAGASPLVLGRLIGARDPATLARYPHAGEAELRAAAERISGEIARLVGAPALASPREVAEGPAPALLDDLARTRWLTPAEAARRSGLTVATLAAYRWQGTGPAFRKIGGRVVYPEAELMDWIAARAQRPPRGSPAMSAGRANGN